MRDYKDIKSKEELLSIAESSIGKKLSFFKSNRTLTLKGNKGSIGQIIEQGLFGLPNNSRSEADFPGLGIELKISGIKKLKKSKEFSAKERLVLNVIDYENEYKYDFYASTFWKKNQHLLLMFYLYDDNIDINDFTIENAFIFEFPEEDLLIIRRDWEYIIDQIRRGNAHNLSEADTMYLGACTKGATAVTSLRSQPFSDIKAPQRAFCLKNSYMTQLVRSKRIGYDKPVKVLDKNIEHFHSFEDYIEYKLKQYTGMGEDEISSMFEIRTNCKNKYERYLAAMLNITGNINKTEEFLKSGLKAKTIRIQENHKIKESMSFPAFDFRKIIKEQWEESDLYLLFSTHKFMFVIFEEIKGAYYFKGVKFWRMPYDILDNSARAVWTKTVEVLKEGNIVREITKSNIRKTNFPGSTFNDYIHVRPHGKDRDDVAKLPVQDKLTGMTSYTKQCFWLNNQYLLKIIKGIG